MLAAITAARDGATVVIFEKNEKLGKKLFITGKGRCNVTNACEKSELFGRLKNVKERGVVLKPGETLDRMFDARAKLYTEYADLTVEEDGTIEDSVNAVLKALESWK